MISLHRDPEVNRRLWRALVGLEHADIRPTDLCRRAKLRTLSEGAGADAYLLSIQSSLSSAVGTPALRRMFKAGLVWQDCAGAPYRLTDAGRDALLSSARS